MISRDKEYYESGTLKTETPYKNGKKDGGQQSYYESGSLKFEGIYIAVKKRRLCKVEL
jgi:antitoxin component YwqK of YwqJK toxin-antitoxin module